PIEDSSRTPPTSPTITRNSDDVPPPAPIVRECRYRETYRTTTMCVVATHQFHTADRGLRPVEPRTADGPDGGHGVGRRVVHDRGCHDVHGGAARRRGRHRGRRPGS